jgi:hypothetical protein
MGAPRLNSRLNTRVINVVQYQIPFSCEPCFVDSNRIGGFLSYPDTRCGAVSDGMSA